MEKQDSSHDTKFHTRHFSFSGQVSLYPPPSSLPYSVNYSNSTDAFFFLQQKFIVFIKITRNEKKTKSTRAVRCCWTCARLIPFYRKIYTISIRIDWKVVSQKILHLLRSGINSLQWASFLTFQSTINAPQIAIFHNNSVEIEINVVEESGFYCFISAQLDSNGNEFEATQKSRNYTE